MVAQFLSFAAPGIEQGLQGALWTVLNTPPMTSILANVQGVKPRSTL